MVRGRNEVPSPTFCWQTQSSLPLRRQVQGWRNGQITLLAIVAPWGLTKKTPLGDEDDKGDEIPPMPRDMGVQPYLLTDP